MKINKINGKSIEDLKSIKETRKKEEVLQISSTKSEERISNQTEVVEVSSQKIIERAVRKALSLPEIREEKVSQIKAQIESGTYNVSNRDIARAMLRNLLEEIA